MPVPRLQSLEVCARAAGGAFGHEEAEARPLPARRRTSRRTLFLALLAVGAAVLAAARFDWAGMVATLVLASGAA